MEYLPVFCGELYQLTRSGIGPGEGFALLCEDEKDKTAASWLEELRRLTQDERLPLSDAMRQTEAFPEYMVDMIDLAEKTGHLEQTLLALKRYYERSLRMRADIRSALTVPVVLLAVMLAVVFILVTQVLPVFDRVFAQLGVRMGGVAMGMMRLGIVLNRIGAGLGIVLCALALAGVVIALHPGLRAKFVGWFRYRFGSRGAFGQMARSRFASVMAMAVSSGMSMDESVESAAKLCGGARDIDSQTAACRELIGKGSGPAEALSECGLFSGRDSRLLLLAERTGSLPDVLEDLAARQEEESLRRIDAIVGAIEPAVVVATSVMAGMILVSVMLPLMGLLSTIG